MRLRSKLIFLSSLLVIFSSFVYLSSVFDNTSTSTPIVLRADVTDKVSILVAFKDEVGFDAQKAKDWAEERGLVFYNTLVPNKLFHFYYYSPLEARRFIGTLLQDPRVETAEFDQLVQPDFTPDDPQFASSWHLNGLSFKEAWEHSMGQGVTIAILDTGVDCDHPDLKNSCVPGINAFEQNYNTSDVLGHGTTVAGAAAEIGNNTLFTAGAAPMAKIMPIRVSNTQGFASSGTIGYALSWAADQGIKVANASYKVSGLLGFNSGAAYFASKGGTVTVSAGNSNLNVTAVSGSPGALTVGSVNSNNQKSSWSDYGLNYLNVVAPGEGILTTQRGGGVAGGSGTSYSAPVTAGLVAMLYALKPNITNAEVVSTIQETATDLGDPGKDLYYGYGVINPAAAVNRVLANGGISIPPPGSAGAPPPPAPPPPSEPPPSLPPTPPPPTPPGDQEVVAPPTPIDEETQQPITQPDTGSTGSTKQKTVNPEPTTDTPTEPVPVIVDELQKYGIELYDPDQLQPVSKVRIKGRTLSNLTVELLVLPGNKRFTETSNDDGDFEFVLDKELELGAYTATAVVKTSIADLPYSNQVSFEVIGDPVAWGNIIASSLAVISSLGICLLLFRRKIPFLQRIFPSQI